MAQEFSFDVVSKVDLQEVDNAVTQAMKEIGGRFDFKGSCASLVLDRAAGTITLVADDEHKRKAVYDILLGRLVKRGVSPKALDPAEPEAASGDSLRQLLRLTQGIASDKAKEIAKNLRESDLKVQAAIQGDQVRVSSKSKDALQQAIARLRAGDWGIALQFTNFR